MTTSFWPYVNYGMAQWSQTCRAGGWSPAPALGVWILLAAHPGVCNKQCTFAVHQPVQPHFIMLMTHFKVTVLLEQAFVGQNAITFRRLKIATRQQWTWLCHTLRLTRPRAVRWAQAHPLSKQGGVGREADDCTGLMLPKKLLSEAPGSSIIASRISCPLSLIWQNKSTVVNFLEATYANCCPIYWRQSYLGPVCGWCPPNPSALLH